MHFRCIPLVPVLAVGVVSLTPVTHAQEVVGVVESSTQGEAQGENQGATNGGPTLESLGLTPDESGNYDTSVLGTNDPRQGAHQGLDQSQGVVPQTTQITAANENTGADSTNRADISTAATAETSLANKSETTTTASASAITGQNTASENTGPASVTTGTASVGVEQVTADNTSTTGSYGEIEHNLSGGSHNGDLVLSFDPAQGDGALDDSFRSVNRVTGSGSDNTVDVVSEREVVTEIQNDGVIHTELDASAVSGKNETLQNTGNASIASGDANVAATLFNFLNASVVDGALWLNVSDVFGDLSGNVVIPEEAVAYLERRQRELLVDVTNSETGSGSTNSLDIDVTNEQTTDVRNEARVENVITVDAITGQNKATQNTGGSTIQTGDIETTTNTVTLANMNVVDGSLGVVIVNALNKWVGYLLGSDGQWAPIEHDYSTVVEAENAKTGSDSENTVDIDVTNVETTRVTNKASVSNTLNLAAITGQNLANQNTGNATVRTGDARVNATVVNVVNTTVVRGGFFAVVVNVFGNWLGNFLFGGNAVGVASAGTTGGVEVTATNERTGTDSTNTIDVDASNEETVIVDNDAHITNTLTVDADTGHNIANRNTGLGSIDTGDVLAVLHARNIANLTVAGLGGSWGDVTADLANATTGADSTNEIDVTVNDERHVTILNDATLDTAIGAVANTGFNTANRNTLGGLVSTGNANVLPRIDNLVNATQLEGVAYGDGPDRVNGRLTNESTGSGSSNASTFRPTQSTEVDLMNAAGISNAVDVSATTGTNEASRNTGGGAVRSGLAGIGGALDTSVNQTDLSGRVLGSLDVSAVNDATVANDASLFASSGSNSTDRNTGQIAFAPAAGGSGPAHGGAPTAPAQSGGGSVSSPPSAGSGGGNGAAPGTGEGGSSEESGSAPHSAKKKAKKVRKGGVKGAQRIAAKKKGHGFLGGGTSTRSRSPWRRPAVRPFPGIRVAEAADGTVLTPDSGSALGTQARVDARRVWPWAALGFSLLVALGSPRRARQLYQRLTQR